MDNQVYQQKNLVHIDPTSASTSAGSSQSAPQTSEEDKAAEQVHKHVARGENARDVQPGQIKCATS